MSETYPKFSDFAEENVGLEGDKKKIDEILNNEILVLGYRIGRSRYKDKDYYARRRGYLIRLEENESII